MNVTGSPWFLPLLETLVAATALGLEVPATLLVHADELIEQASEGSVAGVVEIS